MAARQPEFVYAHIMQKQSMIACYHSLIAAVIKRAIDDLKETDPRCLKMETDQAMAFILSGDCEAYCLELGVDCEAIREKAAALYRKAKGKKPRKARYLNRMAWVSRRAGGSPARPGSLR